MTRSLIEQPHEVRYQIYHTALVAKSPIIIWASKFDLKERIYKLDSDAPKRSLDGLGLGLLRTDLQISEEATKVLYQHNTFKFEGPHEWRRVAAWLSAIGPNRHLLTKLELSVRRPSRAFQYRDGSREAFPDEWIQTAFPKHPLLQRPEGQTEWPRGEVDDVDPEIETIFSLLGDMPTSDPQKHLPVTVYLCIDDWTYPGAYTDPENEYQMMESAHFSMDLPNLIEAWRAKHSTPHRPIHVIWKFAGYKADYDTMVEQFNSAGWHILDGIYDQDQEHGKPDDDITWKMRRRPLSGPIISSDVNPAGWRLPPSKDTMYLQEWLDAGSPDLWDF
ncbi:Hypothetical protein D9617_14g075200 [Elsinoe fawcettii]|nr:Hypothetical protein D9617_14g075200 [Elsinoe fawcettii]